MTPNFPNVSRLVGRATRWCITHSWVALFITACVVLVCGVLAARILVDPAPEAYLRDTEAYETFVRLDRTFGIGETVVVALREPGGTVFDAETVQAIREMDRLIARMPGVKRVLSIASASVLGKVGQEEATDVIDVGRLLAPGPVTHATALELGHRIARHPVYRRLLADGAHESTFVFVQLDSASTEPLRRLALVRAIRKEVDRFQTTARSTHLTGTAVTKEAIASGIQHDLFVFLPAALAMVMLLSWILLRNVIVSLIPPAIAGFSSLVVFGVLGTFGKAINLATAMVPAILVVTALADCLHLINEVRRQFGRTKNLELAWMKAVEGIALPSLLTVVTCASGFLALTASRVAPMRELGIAAAAGLFVTWAANMFITPVVLAMVGIPQKANEPGPRLRQAAAWVTRTAALGGRGMLGPVAVLGLLCGACLAVLTRGIEPREPSLIDANFVEYFDANHRARRDVQTVERLFGGADTIEIFLHADPGAFLNPELLRRVDNMESEIRKVDGVRGVFGFTDFMKLAFHTVAGKDWPMEPDSASFELPTTKEAISQLLLLDAEGFQAASAPDMSQVRMTIQVPTRSTEDILSLTSRIESVATEIFPTNEVAVTVTGLLPMFANVVRYVVEDAFRSLGLVALAIWLSMVVGFRSVQLATVAFLATAIPVGLTLATALIVGLRLDVNTVLAACLGLGVTVHGAVYFVGRYRRARQEGAPGPTTGLPYALLNAGWPMALTALTLLSAFSVLWMSSFMPTVRVGLLASLFVAYAFLFQVFVAPILLVAVDRLGEHFEPAKRARPSTISGHFRGARLTEIPKKRSPTPHAG